MVFCCIVSYFEPGQSCFLEAILVFEGKQVMPIFYKDFLEKVCKCSKIKNLCLMSFVAHRFGRVEFRIFVYIFSTAPA